MTMTGLMSFQEQNGSDYLTADTRGLDLGSAGASSAQAGPAGLFARTHNGGEIPSSALTNAFNHSDGDGNVTFHHCRRRGNETLTLFACLRPQDTSGSPGLTPSFRIPNLCFPIFLRSLRFLLFKFGGIFACNSNAMRYGGHVIEANTVGRDLLAAPAQREGIAGLLARPENWKLDAGAPFATAFYHSDGDGNVTFLLCMNGIFWTSLQFGLVRQTDLPWHSALAGLPGGTADKQSQSAAAAALFWTGH